MSDPVYLGFDLSTQQLKCLAITSNLKVLHEVKWDFDADSTGFNVKKGVITNVEDGEVFTPVAMWLQALDGVLDGLKSTGLDFSRIKGLSGAGMQHGSVFWSKDAERILADLDPLKPLENQLHGALSHPHSPNWQDMSTQKECDEFDRYLGDEETLAQTTGSKAHHRFTGPQILRFQRKHPDKYKHTARISLVSSWIPSIFLGKFAPIDISDVCGMNLWDILQKNWNEKLLELCAGDFGVEELKQKLGDVPEDGGATLGSIAKYFVTRFGFPPDCKVIAGTGDNPATILALPLLPNDAIVSLGTSSTFLMSTPQYKPSPAYHFFGSPATQSHFMFMLCYKNGGLARERVRDAINNTHSMTDAATWEHFDRALLETPPLAQTGPQDTMKLGIYFHLPEIVPHLPAGEWHYEYEQQLGTLIRTKSATNPPNDDARIIVESQFLSMRLRSQSLLQSPGSGLPPQPRRIYLVGGGSRNKAIAKVCGEVLGGSEGIFKLDVGANACALGAAHKAVWGVERKSDQSFEDLIGQRWSPDAFIKKIADGYQKGTYEKYGEALKGYGQMEQELLKEYARE